LLTDALDICFRNQPFSYSIIEKIIVIKEKNTACCPSAQPTLTGDDVEARILDENGEPWQGNHR